MCLQPAARLRRAAGATGNAAQSARRSRPCRRLTPATRAAPTALVARAGRLCRPARVPRPWVAGRANRACGAVRARWVWGRNALSACSERSPISYDKRGENQQRPCFSALREEFASGTI